MTSSCLSDKQARRKIGDAYDEMNFVIQELNDTNAAGTFTLSTRSYRVDMLSARWIKETIMQTITEARSLEQLEMFSNASTHGAKLFATGGGHSTSDEFFISVKIPVWEAAIK